MPSNRDVATYDLAPEMSAAPVTDGVVEALKPGGPDFILVNYANPDMVGHTGKLKPGDQRHGDDRRLHRPHHRGGGGGGRDRVHHRRSRQLRDDDRSGDRPAAHRPHHEPGPVHRHRARSGRRASCARAGGSPTWRPPCWIRWGSRSRRRWTAQSLFEEGADEHRQATHRSRARRAELAARQGGARRRRRRRPTDGGVGRGGDCVGHDRRRAGGRDRAPASGARGGRGARSRTADAAAARRRAPRSRAVAAAPTAAGDDAIRKAYAALEVPAGSDFETVRKVVPPLDAQVPPRPARRLAREAARGDRSRRSA